MKRMTQAVIVVAAAIAGMAMIAGTALAAAPEFLAEGGKSAAGTAFTSTTGASKLQPKEGALAVECTAGSSEGTIAGLKTVAKVTVKFTGCKEKTLKGECKSPGAAKGQLITAKLEGEIGPIEGGSGDGLKLEPEAESETEEFVTVECPAATVKVTGSLVGELVRTHELSTKNELVYKQTAGVQAITSFTGTGEKDFLTAGSFGQAGLEATHSITFSKAVELGGTKGAAEEQKISIITNPKAVMGKECPERAGRVIFKALGEVCEYKVENKNAVEPVYVEKVTLAQEVQCIGVINNCLTKITPENTPRCDKSLRATKLGPGGVCYLQLEYTKKPGTPPGLTSLTVETKSTPGGAKKEVGTLQTVE
jgi:hypothetical protein